MMVADHIGLIAARRLPVWLREGYAEYVARHDTFDYETTRTRFLAGDETLGSSDRYWKYLLLVTHLLDREGRSRARCSTTRPIPTRWRPACEGALRGSSDRQRAPPVLGARGLPRAEARGGLPGCPHGSVLARWAARVLPPPSVGLGAVLARARPRRGVALL